MGSMGERMVWGAILREVCRPRRASCIPRVAGCFLEKIGHGLQVVAEEIGGPEQRLFIEILTTPEQRPAGLLQDRARPSRLVRRASSARTSSTALGMNSKRRSAS